MSGVFARVSVGKFTSIRYTKQDLLFNKTLENILLVGDSVVPVLEPLENLSKVGGFSYRDVSPSELELSIRNKRDVDNVLLEYDKGKTVPTLDKNSKLSSDVISDNTIRYKGSWDPIRNIPNLYNGMDIPTCKYIANGEYGDIEEHNFGKGMEVIYCGGEVIYLDGIWYSYPPASISGKYRDKLDKVMINRNNPSMVDGTRIPLITHSPEDIVLLGRGSINIGVFTENANGNYPYLLDSDGLMGFGVHDYGNEFVVDGTLNKPGVYKPKFIASMYTIRGIETEITITILDYVMDAINPITVYSGDINTTEVTSEVDDSPNITVVDSGGLWDVHVENGSRVTFDTNYSPSGKYIVRLKSTKDGVDSDTLEVEINVMIRPGLSEPMFFKIDLISKGIDNDMTFYSNLGMLPLDSIPLG